MLQVIRQAGRSSGQSPGAKLGAPRCADTAAIPALRSPSRLCTPSASSRVPKSQPHWRRVAVPAEDTLDEVQEETQKHVGEGPC